MLKEKVHIAVPTAFFEDESLNVHGTIDHIKNLHHQGIKSVLVCGTTGEQHSLSLEEKTALLDGLVSEKELLNEMEVLFGVASIRQKEAELLADKISTTNISGVMLGYPPYIIPSQEEAVAYSRSIIQRSSKPAILYNNPKRTGFDLSTASIVKLSRLDSVIGIKEAGNKEKVTEMKQLINKQAFYFYIGGEIDAAAKIASGFNRLSSMAGNIAPVEFKNWFLKKLADEDLTDQENETIKGVTAEVNEGNPVVNIKRLLHEEGIDLGTCRSPIGSVHR
ncbi:dihydrodipicolinate synthase family protein [Alkalicoccus saliphilus]|uniref:Dihydrodipicolinate synthase family protein n=1 Tax=Alkalicoccus saliphilus TaxID=200989 RepID=A0A2T4U4Q3_9BACI|nr:dihydrodipicolinate synthase family protein [Alkalicoccus saliphilus]PTL38386.1 dihydrodipicolinate synthase family protein [Alkalicoccus saliphilus]